MAMQHDENPNEYTMSDSVKLGVLIHRMGALESGMSTIGEKLDNISNLYPTLATVELILAPLRTSIKDLETDKKEAEKEAVKNASQLKLALIMALASPVITWLVIAFLERGGV